MATSTGDVVHPSTGYEQVIEHRNNGNSKYIGAARSVRKDKLEDLIVSCAIMDRLPDPSEAQRYGRDEDFLAARVKSMPEVFKGIEVQTHRPMISEKAACEEEGEDAAEIVKEIEEEEES